MMANSASEFVLNIPITEKVIWRLGHGLESNSTGWGSWGSNSRTLRYKASGLSTTPLQLPNLESTLTGKLQWHISICMHLQPNSGSIFNKGNYFFNFIYAYE